MDAETDGGLVRLLRQDELPEPLRSLGSRYLLDLARAGKLGQMRAIRMTSKTPPLFREDHVLAFLESKIEGAP